MIKQLIKDTKKYIFNNPSLIKLTFWIGFCRSASILLLLAYNINNILIYRFGKGLSIFTLFQYFINEISSNHIIWLIVVLIVLMTIGYIILYPIGIAAIIHFLKNEKKTISSAIGKGAGDFFTMFELNALAFSFGPYTYLVTILRLLTLDVLNNGFIIGLLILWGLAVLFSSIFWQYAKFIIIDEQIGVFEAIKKSISLTILNIGITIKGLITKTIIIIIFYFKMIIIVSIPLLIMYFLLITNITTDNQRIIRTIGIVTTILAAYIIAITQAFFMIFRHKIYTKLLNKDIEKIN